MDFAHRWNSLPIELKELIISYDAVSHDAQTAQSVEECHRWWDYTVAGQLHEHLRSTPEFAGIAQEVFCRQNTFSLESTSKSQTMYSYKLRVCTI
jgi:hypothetical protein